MDSILAGYDGGAHGLANTLGRSPTMLGSGGKRGRLPLRASGRLTAARSGGCR